MISIGVTFDHRFMDGFQAGKMLQIFRGYLEDPSAHEGIAAGAPALAEGAPTGEGARSARTTSAQ
jgi:hypothetical protein